MPAPIVVAAAAHRNRKPLAAAAGTGFACLMVIPMLMGGAPKSVADPCSGVAAQPVSAPPATSTGSTSSASVGFALPAPGAGRQNSLQQPALTIPANWKSAYEKAAGKYGVPWTLLAGIGMEETGQGRNVAVSSAGAQGPMQFMPATWATVGADGNGDGTKDIHNVEDAIAGTANYLVKSGAKQGPEGVKKAIFAYNHASWYVNDVLYYAQQYGGGQVVGAPGGGGCSADDGPVSASGDWANPLGAAHYVITSPFGWRNNPGRGGARLMHYGDDMAIASGTPIHAACTGKVVQEINIEAWGGNQTWINCGGSPATYTAYMHQSKFVAKVGDQVKAGQVIGLSGGDRGAPGAGDSTGAHLHFQVQRGTPGDAGIAGATDPIAFMASKGIRL